MCTWQQSYSQCPVNSNCSLVFSGTSTSCIHLSWPQWIGILLHLQRGFSASIQILQFIVHVFTKGLHFSTFIYLHVFLSGSITWLTFHRDHLLLSASEDGTICVWKCGDPWSCLCTLTGHKWVHIWLTVNSLQVRNAWRPFTTALLLGTSECIYDSLWIVSKLEMVDDPLPLHSYWAQVSAYMTHCEQSSS